METEAFFPINTLENINDLDSPRNDCLEHNETNPEDPIIIEDLNKTLIDKELVIEDEPEHEEPKSKSRRSLRKKVNAKIETVRESKTVKKLNENSSLKDIENFYLSKKVKRLPSSLETIFEEPKPQRGKIQYASSRKFKRTLNFNEDLATINRLKVKKRRLKAKELGIGRSFFNRKKATVENLLGKLATIEEIDSL